MLIDSHCHLDDPRFNGQHTALISAAAEAGVSDCVLPATTTSSWQPIAKLATCYANVHPAYGLHPWFLDQHEEGAINQLTSWIEHHPTVAIGECGLDFSREEHSHQEELFADQIELAQQTGLPLIIHAHKALDRVIQLLRHHSGVRGVVHRFAGSQRQAEQLTELGIYIGVAAGITYPKQAKLRRTIAALPLETLLLESDAPDLPPAGITDPLNAPQLLPLTLKALAELLTKPLAEVSQQTTLNTQQLFNI
ncbi:MAG: TatD family deoxyribonuclease [Gammaproteobacteria bacterium]|nr:MAG: TatD family deoxyribonuclease [Gammaproteobacteria bacterium]